MSELHDLAKNCGSLRYARDLIETTGQVDTRPWWLESHRVLYKLFDNPPPPNDALKKLMATGKSLLQK
jgi:uncharacterized protein (DUF1778 family)